MQGEGDVPCPGFFRLRIVKGGPYVPAVIYRPCPIEMHIDAPWQWVDRWYPLRARYDVTILGQMEKPVPPERVWMWGEEIDYQEFRGWCETRRHIRQYEPDAFDANPLAPADLARADPVGPRRRP